MIISSTIVSGGKTLPNSNIKSTVLVLAAGFALGNIYLTPAAHAQPGILVNSPKVIRGNWHGRGYYFKVTAESLSIYHHGTRIAHITQLIHQNWIGHQYAVWGSGSRTTIWKYSEGKMFVKLSLNAHKFYRVYR